MICNRTDKGWQIIYQRAHALLAAKLVTYCRRQWRPIRWAETLNAVGQHDNGWQEWESGSRLKPNGEPRSFRETPIEETAAQAKRALTRAWHQSLWAALMVSRHIETLYAELNGQLEELDALVEAQAECRREWRANLGVDEAEEHQAYGILRFGDALSLMLCERRLETTEEPVEIGEGPNGLLFRVWMPSKGQVSLEPWPYTRHKFLVSVDSYDLDAVQFESEQDLAEALREATPRQLEWLVTR
jgi:hypothetical protein